MYTRKLVTHQIACTNLGPAQVIPAKKALPALNQRNFPWVLLGSIGNAGLPVRHEDPLAFAWQQSKVFSLAREAAQPAPVLPYQFQ